MSELRVVTFEAIGGGARRVAAHDSLAASSAGIPAGAYTTLRTYERRRVLRLEAHLARLEESAALQDRPGTIDRREARSAIVAALDATAHAESRLRLTFAPPRLFVAVEPFTPLPGAVYQAGIACVTLDIRRDNPHAKDTRFISTAQGAYSRLPAGVDEGLLGAEDGSILEGLSSNFFAVVDGALRTEDERVLLGVTRSLVLEVAQSLMPVVRRPVTRDLVGISEAFITSVSREVLPVVRIDGRPLGEGRVGPRTRAVLEGFRALVKREAELLS